jgi:hypothetical protein
VAMAFLNGELKAGLRGFIAPAWIILALTVGGFGFAGYGRMVLAEDRIERVTAMSAEQAKQIEVFLVRIAELKLAAKNSANRDEALAQQLSGLQVLITNFLLRQ